MAEADDLHEDEHDLFERRFAAGERAHDLLAKRVGAIEEARDASAGVRRERVVIWLIVGELLLGLAMLGLTALQLYAMFGGRVHG